MIFGILIPLLSLAVLVVVARKLFSRDSHGAPSTFSVRRLFQYALLFGLLVVSASGVSGLIGRLFDSGQVIAASRTDLARDITFAIIGIPLYFAMSRWTRRTLNEDPSERHSVAWNAYLSIVSISALITAMTAAFRVLNWALGEEPFRGADLSQFLIWGLVWVAHWQLIETGSREEEARAHYISGSLVGLGTLAFGIGGLIASTARTLIESDEKSLLVDSGNRTIQAISLIIISLPVWYQYWLKKSLSMKRELFWYSYTLLIGVAGGFLTLVISGSVMIYDLLVWYVGDPQETLAARHFDSSAGALGSAIVGLATWWYHANVVNSPVNAAANSQASTQVAETSAATKSRDEVRRVYEYIISGISLIAAAAGMMMIFVAIIESVTPGEVVSTTSSTNTLMVAITLLIVGAPIWYFFWSRIESHLVADGEEISSPTRRIFLLMLFGVASVAAVISVLTAVFLFLDDLLNNELGQETLRQMRFAIAILVSNAAIGWYHWNIYRDERKVNVRKARKDKFVVLVGPRDESLARAIQLQFGGHVQMWQSEDQEQPGTVQKSSEPAKSIQNGVSGWDRQKVIDLIESTRSDEVMVIKEKRGIKAIPFSRGR
ncbi:MAG: hypothetical protein FGM49_04080 [Candidatus Nanopelagicaceae bacterium]|nr:hypothetical protein [Candidatus Nanopelagicaceae bacterium]